MLKIKSGSQQRGECSFNEGDDGMKALHSIDDFVCAGLLTFSKKDGWDRVFLQNRIDKVLLFLKGPDQLALVAPVYE
jgi:hypothetical protein